MIHKCGGIPGDTSVADNSYPEGWHVRQMREKNPGDENPVMDTVWDIKCCPWCGEDLYAK